MAEETNYHDPFHSPVWDSTDASRLRNLLTQRTGKRLILRLRLDRPSLPFGPAAHDPHAVALAAKEMAGYERAISNIFDYLVTQPVENAKTEAYPNLDDDAAWPPELQKLVREVTPPKENTDAPAS